MKQIYKNIEVPAIVERMKALTNLQSAMTLACMRNNLYLKSTIDSDAKHVVFGYEVFLDRQCELPFIAGRCASNGPLILDHFTAAMDIIEGRVVSIAMPPVGEGLPDEVKPLYWKRQLIHTADATDFTKPVGDGRTMAVWSGFNNLHVEVMRIPEGTQNPGHEKVRAVKYQYLGDKGVIVNPVLIGQEPPVRTEPSLATAGSGPTTYTQAMSSAAVTLSAPISATTTKPAVVIGEVVSVDTKSANSGQVTVINETTVRLSSFYEGIPVTITCGFDRSVGGFFMTIKPFAGAYHKEVNGESGMLYSNLDDSELAFPRLTGDLKHYQNVLLKMKIPFKTDFFDMVWAIND